MSGQQLCFFKFSRPLVELLGQEFFRTVPPEPGVYLFLGEQRRVLYVGQSKNLRLRLAYYKNAQPEREPRRIIRMVHQTRSIEFEKCENAQTARAREVELIQEHRPRFNVQHALSRTYSFFGVRCESAQLTLRLAMEESAQPGETFLGAFKNRGLCRRALFAVGRTLWSTQRAPQSVYHFPFHLIDRTKVNEVQLSVGERTAEEVIALLNGDLFDFAKRTEGLLLPHLDPHLRKLWEGDLLTLTEFFELAVRMRKLRERSGVRGVLPQKEVDRQALTRDLAPNLPAGVFSGMNVETGELISQGSELGSGKRDPSGETTVRSECSAA